MVYESRHLKRQKVLYNSTNTNDKLVYQPIVNGAKFTLSTDPSISIYAPGSTTALVDGGSMARLTSYASYAVDTTTTSDWPIQTGYRAEISYTIGGAGRLDVLMFDVVRFILRMDVGVDQLVALDERVAAMAHNSDDDFSEIIEAVRDKLQLKIETRVLKDGHLLENMILDKSKVSIPARYYVLAAIYEEKRDYEQADRFKEEADELWRLVMSSIKFDANQDGEEDSTVGGLQDFRLVY